MLHARPHRWTLLPMVLAFGLWGCSVSDEPLGGAPRDFGTGSTWAKASSPADAKELGVPEASFSVVKGSGGRLSVDDLAVVRVHWSQGSRSGAAWVTLNGFTDPLDAEAQSSDSGELRAMDVGKCGAGTLPKPSCMAGNGRWGARHPLNTKIRQALDWREVGSEVRLELGQGKSAAELARKAAAEPVTLLGSSNPYQGADFMALDKEPLVVTAQLIGACFPQWIQRSTTTYSIPAMKSIRKEIVLDSCEDMGPAGKTPPSGFRMRTVVG